VSPKGSILKGLELMRSQTVHLRLKSIFALRLQAAND
jgi:hypothetical protein